MKLARAGEVLVPKSKIVEYLLSPTHRAGRSKAVFFGRFGFSADRWQEMAEALRSHATDNEVTRSEITAFGTRSVIDGPLRAPNGSVLNVRSVWFTDTEGAVPRFVTAHPLRRSKR